MILDSISRLSVLPLISLRKLIKGHLYVVYLNLGGTDYSMLKHFVDTTFDAISKSYMHYSIDECKLELMEAITVPSIFMVEGLKG